jgi:hypothetical protein
MKFAIPDNGWKVVSNNRVIQFLKINTGRDYPFSAVRSWTDAERAALNVLRVVDVRPALDELQAWTGEDVVPTGLIAEHRATASDKPLADALSIVKSRVNNKFYGVRDAGTVILTKPVGTSLAARTLLNTYQSALSSGVTFPVNGLTIILMDGEKVKVNEAQWTTLLRGVGVHCLQAVERWDALIDAAEAAADVPALRVVLADAEAGWPANPTL